MNQLTSLVRFLNEPRLVAKVQRLFGIHIIDVISSAPSDSTPSTKATVITKTRCDDTRQRSANVEQKDGYEKHHRVSTMSDSKCVYAIDNPLIYWFFMAVTHLGQEVFYILFLPMLAWNYDWHEVKRKNNTK